MAVQIHCRGCGLALPETAQFCFICKCPDPGCQASHVVAKSSVAAPVTESGPNVLVWGIFAAATLLFAAVAIVGVLAVVV
jgi:hypothetical protein